MGNVYIFEGHDLAGKTSIAKKVSEITGIPYVKFDGPKNVKSDRSDMAKAQINTFLDICEKTDVSMIVDRYWLSEYVYSKVFGRKVDEKYFKEVYARSVKANIINIIVMCSDKTLEVRIKKRSEKKHIIKKITDIREEYLKAAKTFPQNTHTFISFNNSTIAHEAKIVAAMLVAPLK